MIAKNTSFYVIMSIFCGIMGTFNIPQNMYSLSVSIINSKKEVLSVTTEKYISVNTLVTLDTSKLKEEDYIIRFEIKDKAGKTYSSFDKCLKAVSE